MSIGSVENLTSQETEIRKEAHHMADRLNDAAKREDADYLEDTLLDVIRVASYQIILLRKANKSN